MAGGGEGISGTGDWTRRKFQSFFNDVDSDLRYGRSPDRGKFPPKSPEYLSFI